MALTIQERLKDLRVECGLTLEQLAEQTHLSKSALGSYEAEDFKDISHYTLSSGETQTESATQTGTVSTGIWAAPAGRSRTERRPPAAEAAQSRTMIPHGQSRRARCRRRIAATPKPEKSQLNANHQAVVIQQLGDFAQLLI